MDIKEYIKQLTDDELLTKANKAYIDTKEAAIKDRNSEDHQNCLAGLIVLANEVCRRGLSVQTQ